MNLFLSNINRSGNTATRHGDDSDNPIMEISNERHDHAVSSTLTTERCTSLIEDKHFGETHFRDRFRGVEIYPRSKLIICIPAKAGSSLDREIRGELNERLPLSHQIRPWTHDEITEMNHLKSYYFCNDSYTKIFMVRDPLSRLLSGYLDKCTESVYPYTRPASFVEDKGSYFKHCSGYLLSIGIDTEWILRHEDEYEANPDRFRNGNASNTVGGFAEQLLKESKENERGVDDHFSLMRIYGGMHYSDELI